MTSPIENTTFPVLEAHEFTHAGLRCVVALLACAPTPMWVGYVEVPVLVGIEEPKFCTFRAHRFPLWCPLTVRTGCEVFGWDGWAHHPRTTDRVIDSLDAAIKRTREFAGSPAGPKGFPSHDVETVDEPAPEPNKLIPERNCIEVSRALVASIPATNATASARARVLSALDDLWDDLVLAEKPSEPPAGVIMAAIGGAL